jgi:hypothetical protein
MNTNWSIAPFLGDIACTSVRAHTSHPLYRSIIASTTNAEQLRNYDSAIEPHVSIFQVMNITTASPIFPSAG